MEITEQINKLICSPLFWDTQASNIDTEQNARFIIERIITRGTFQNWKLLLDYYGHDRVLKEALMIRTLDPKSLCYLSVFFNVEETKFRCFS